MSLAQLAATARRGFKLEATVLATVTAAGFEASYLTTRRVLHTTQTTIKLLVIAAASDSF